MKVSSNVSACTQEDVPDPSYRLSRGAGVPGPGGQMSAQLPPNPTPPRRAPLDAAAGGLHDRGRALHDQDGSDRTPPVGADARTQVRDLDGVVRNLRGTLLL